MLSSLLLYFRKRNECAPSGRFGDLHKSYIDIILSLHLWCANMYKTYKIAEGWGTAPRQPPDYPKKNKFYFYFSSLLLNVRKRNEYCTVQIFIKYSLNIQNCEGSGISTASAKRKTKILFQVFISF